MKLETRLQKLEAVAEAHQSGGAATACLDHLNQIADIVYENVDEAERRRLLDQLPPLPMTDDPHCVMLLRNLEKAYGGQRANG